MIMFDSSEEDALEAMVSDQLGWCGCGNPAAAIDLLHKVLSILRERCNEYVAPQLAWGDWYRVLKAVLCYDRDPGIYYTYLYHLDDKKLIEHGGNVGGAWLTSEGDALLDALNESEVEYFSWDSSKSIMEWATEAIAAVPPGAPE
jgi:hypothetical protein